ncbi:hypothetical protein B9S53_07800 [Arthrospira sp. O9.13F]|nr:hypothetical protein B9S53_07800 [Arthrospira sp. O9.13F]
MSDRLWVRKFTPTRKLPIITVIIPLLALTLWGCSPVGITPTPTLVQQALTIQIKEIHQQLKLQSDFARSPQSFKITRVAISNMEPIMINNLQGFKVEGTYNLSVKFSDRWWREQQNRFQIYLQRQAQGRIWRLARLENQTNRWSTVPIPHRRF